MEDLQFGPDELAALKEGAAALHNIGQKQDAQRLRDLAATYGPSLDCTGSVVIFGAVFSCQRLKGHGGSHVITSKSRDISITWTGEDSGWISR